MTNQAPTPEALKAHAAAHRALAADDAYRAMNAKIRALVIRKEKSVDFHVRANADKRITALVAEADAYRDAYLAVTTRALFA